MENKLNMNNILEDELNYLVDVIMSILSNNTIIICIILYFIIGFIVMLLWNLMDMRGKDYDKDFSVM